MNLDRMFQAGVALAVWGVVWAVWPQPGEAAYGSLNRHRHSAYRHGPPVMIDRGHWNRSRGDPRFEGLYQLLAGDGYRVSRNRQEFVPELLRTAWVLVIPDALGWKGALGLHVRAEAFSPAEVRAVRDWVHGGGSLLLIADRPPAGQASQPLASAFGVQLSDGGAPAIRLGREGGLGDNTISNGRPEEGEEVNFAMSFGGGDLSGPPDGMKFLKKQGIAFESGRGRVVVLTAQLAGISARKTDNRQLLLNIMHWLSRAE
jgi:hypothetical protein